MVATNDNIQSLWQKQANAECKKIKKIKMNNLKVTNIYLQIYKENGLIIKT